MEKVLKLKTIKNKTKQKKIKTTATKADNIKIKTSNLNKIENISDSHNIDTIIDEFLSSFQESNNQLKQTNDKVNQQITIVPQPVYSIIDESQYDLGDDSNNYESNLLLAYNYFITPKTILSIGFAPHIHFKSVAILRQNNKEIVFDLFLWKQVIEATKIIEQATWQQSEIETPFLERELIEINDPVKQANIKICFTVDRKFIAKIIIYQNKNKIILDFNAWQKLYLLDYMTQCVLYNYKDTDENVRQYYSQYIQRCAENQLMFLLKNNLMTPTLKNQNMWNYERFFCELAVLCPKKLQFDIQKKINLK